MTALAGVDVGGGGIRVRVERDGASAYGEDTAPVPREHGHIDLDRLATGIIAVVEHATPDAEPPQPAAEGHDAGQGQLTDGLDAGHGRLTNEPEPGQGRLTDEPDAGRGRLAGGASAGAGLKGMAIGLTGLPGLVEDPGRLWHALRGRLGLDTLVVAGDLVTTYVGALGFRQGAVVAAGTGVIALGTDLAGVWNQSDGWGHLLGDHGGGAWIGAQGLHAALRAHDGRAGGSTTLLERLTARFGRPLDLVALMYEPGVAAHLLASFAPDVAEAARAGDPVAQEIWAEAGRQLAQTAVAAAKGLEPVFSWGGRLFDAGDLLMSPFQDEVRALLPGATFVPPRGSSADGALALSRAAAEGRVRPRHPYLYVFSAKEPDGPSVNGRC